jgi:hypothetical protein
LGLVPSLCPARDGRPRCSTPATASGELFGARAEEASEEASEEAMRQEVYRGTTGDDRIDHSVRLLPIIE